jgi:hypothetical protein
MTEQRNQRELLWFQAGGALNFITAAPHCGDIKVFWGPIPGTPKKKGGMMNSQLKYGNNSQWKYILSTAIGH